MRLFQAALDTPLDNPFSATLSVHGLHFTVCAPSNWKTSRSWSRGRELNTNLYFLKLFGHPRDIPAKSRDIAPKSLVSLDFGGHTELLGPHPFTWKTPTPPENIRTKKFGFGFLFSSLNRTSAGPFCWSCEFGFFMSLLCCRVKCFATSHYAYSSVLNPRGLVVRSRRGMKNFKILKVETEMFKRDLKCQDSRTSKIRKKLSGD